MPPYYTGSSPEHGNTSDGPIADQSIKFLPTWRPDDDARSKDVRECRIAPAELSGEFTAFPDANNPATLQRQGPGAFLPSHGLNREKR